MAALTNVPPLETTALSGIAFGRLLAFFAFTRFEDLANVVDEAKQPRRGIPRAMVLTLLIYGVVRSRCGSRSLHRVDRTPRVVAGAAQFVPSRGGRGQSEDYQPHRDCGGAEHDSNQMTLASRVIYGLARDGTGICRTCLRGFTSSWERPSWQLLDYGLCDSARAVGPVSLVGGRVFVWSILRC